MFLELKMTLIREALYYTLLKEIGVCAVPLLLVGVVRTGVFSSLPYLNFASLALIMFLRATMVSPTWSMRLRWTMLVCVPIEASLYGNGLVSHLIAFISFLRFVVGYGFVLNVNPVQKIKDTISNRSLEILASAIVVFVFAPHFIQGLITQLSLSIHMLLLSSNTIKNVCESSGVFSDPDLRRQALAELPKSIKSIPRIPIEIWLLAYYCATRNVNFLPQELVSEILTFPQSPWQLRRLVIRAVSSDPTRSQMKLLLDVAKSDNQILTRSVSKTHHNYSLWSKGPQALISEEANERIVMNEAILTLARLHDSLGERKLIAAFDRSVDAKLAIDIVSRGFK